MATASLKTDVTGSLSIAARVRTVGDRVKNTFRRSNATLPLNQSSASIASSVTVADPQDFLHWGPVDGPKINGRDTIVEITELRQETPLSWVYRAKIKYKDDAEWWTQSVAVKFVNTCSDEVLEAANKMVAMRMPAIWSKLHHQNILEYYGVMSVHGHPLHVSPWAPRGDLNGYYKLAYTKLTFQDRQRIARKCLEAFQYMHGLGYVHGDIQPGNILISATYEPLVADFGTARDAKGDGTGSTAPQLRSMGSYPYLAPELLAVVCARMEKGMDPAKLPDFLSKTTSSDVYAFVGLWFFILSSDEPWPRTTKPNVILEDCRAKRFPGFREGVDGAHAAYMRSVWSAAPEERPSLKEMSEHELFRAT